MRARRRRKERTRERKARRRNPARPSQPRASWPSSSWKLAADSAVSRGEVLSFLCEGPRAARSPGPRGSTSSSASSA
eukprot:3280501-Pyramimonas_sp.AAC.1